MLRFWPSGNLLFCHVHDHSCNFSFSFSVNSIKTLVDFQNCYGLQELYIRKNNITNLRDICYLKGLPNLKSLWLADNPCTQVEGYRLAVIKALPQLEKLDDIIIKPNETEGNIINT